MREGGFYDERDVNVVGLMFISAFPVVPAIRKEGEDEEEGVRQGRRNAPYPLGGAVVMFRHGSVVRRRRGRT